MNGGLSSFFECDPPGTVDYKQIAQVYRRIGATVTADCILAAADMFPFENPHQEYDRRLEFMELERAKLDASNQKTGEYQMLFDDLDRKIFGEEPDEKIMSYARTHYELLQPTPVKEH